MGVASWTLLALIGLLVANQLLLRTRLIAYPAAFWSVQALNVALAVAVFFVPVPGFERMPAIRVVIAMLFLLRVAYGWRTRVLYSQRQDIAALEEEERSRRRDPVTRGDGDPPRSP